MWVQHSYLEEALAINRRRNDIEAVARVLHNLGNVHVYRGDHDSARRFYEEALAINTERRRCDWKARNLEALGVIELENCHWDVARRYLEEAGALFRSDNDRRGMVLVLRNLSLIAVACGDVARAQALDLESITIAREFGHRNLLTLGLVDHAQLRLRVGDMTEARRALLESLTIIAETGDKHAGMAALRATAAYCAELAGIGSAQPIRLRLRSAWLLAAAEGLRVALGSPIPLNERPEHERIWAMLREALDDETLEAARTRGQTMDYEEAMHCARVELEARPDAQPAAAG